MLDNPAWSDKRNPVPTENSFLRNAKLALLPRSREKKDLVVATREWYYTGDLDEAKDCSATCELCRHCGLRYLFVIRNEHTGHRLYVGSKCIRRFPGFRIIGTDGNRLDTRGAHRQLASDLKQALRATKQNRVVETLLALGRQSHEFEIDTFIGYYCEQKAFTPKQLSTLLWQFKKYRINYDPSDFKVKVRRHREQRQLLEMERWQLERMWPCLSRSQHKWARERRADLWEVATS